jgi:hypothetical protein
VTGVFYFRCRLPFNAQIFNKSYNHEGLFQDRLTYGHVRRPGSPGSTTSSRFLGNSTTIIWAVAIYIVQKYEKFLSQYRIFLTQNCTSVDKSNPQRKTAHFFFHVPSKSPEFSPRRGSRSIERPGTSQTTTVFYYSNCQKRKKEKNRIARFHRIGTTDGDSCVDTNNARFRISFFKRFR